ncbi:hypothetical protein J5N97_023461 [Dioscorea zingiberensis]|uniref:Uncharacterized protein n=1 Tax=Dioscorea zingiberensis TaxID=325984 RepID=A0A9D5H7V7_9LILI|nr:hypothetical protein J5N97_023461 [Dioscorea zingiberensis]
MASSTSPARDATRRNRMATASLLFSPSLPARTPSILRNPHGLPSLHSLNPLHGAPSRSRTLAIVSAVVEPSSSKPLQDDPPLLPLLQELAESLVLPSDFLAKLPGDLRLDLNDAAFDLSNGPVIDECGREVGEMLLNLSRAWEQADTSSSNSIARQLPSLEGYLSGYAKSAFGARLVSAGRRFEAMGMYGQGELQKVAKAMIKTGKLLTASPLSKNYEKPKNESRVLKFGELQVEVTPENAYIGAAIGIVFGIISWQLGQGVQSIPESSMQYANDNALLLAKSLRGTLLVIFYSSTILSAFTSVGLVLLGRELSSKSKSKDL